MAEGPSKLALFIADLKRRGVTRLATIYAVVGLGIIEAFDIIGSRFLLPDWTFRVLIIIVIAGFPLAMILGWIYDITSRGIVKTEPLTTTQKASLRLSWKPGWFSIILLFILFITTTAFFIVPRPNALGFRQQDWIMMAELENNTGDESFDKTLLQALTVTIDQSRRINIFPGTQADEVLKRMKMDTVKHITLPIAMEIAERESIKAVLLLTISELEGTYVLSTSLIDPFSGETIRSSQVTAAGKGEILSALNNLAISVRKDLGDSLQKIHLQTVPLVKATTHSLEALKYYTDARNVTGDQYYEKSMELLHKAIELDPEFAMAHSQLGACYYWVNDRVKGDKHISIALDQLDRLTEKERLWIEAAVEGYRGNREASISKWGVYLTQYPDSYGAWFRLGYNLMRLRRLEESIQAFNRASEIYKDADWSSLINIATCYNMLNEHQNAVDYYQKSLKANPDWVLTNNSLNHEYGFSYVEMGETDKGEEVFSLLLEGDEDNRAQSKRSLALLRMYQGRYTEALELMHDAVILHISTGYRLSELRNRLYLCKIYQTKGMQDEFQSELDYCYSIIKDVASEPNWYKILGLMLVRNGETERAEEMLNELAERSNEGNKRDDAAYMQLKGEIELANGNFEEALELLETAVVLDASSCTKASVARYYMEKGEWSEAIAAYEDLLADKLSLGWEGQECWLRAHLGLIRACRYAGENEKAGVAYEEIMSIWEEGDPELLAAILTHSE